MIEFLLDTPCSGEGRFIAEIAGTYRNWSLKTVKELSKIQRKLIKSGYNALKPGGIMVYSTCTLNLEENENIFKMGIGEFKSKNDGYRFEYKKAQYQETNWVQI